MKIYQKPSVELLAAQVQSIVCSSESWKKHAAQHIVHHLLYG